MIKYKKLMADPRTLLIFVYTIKEVLHSREECLKDG
jgi:hypothetical protein